MDLCNRLDDIIENLEGLEKSGHVSTTAEPRNIHTIKVELRFVTFFLRLIKRFGDHYLLKFILPVCERWMEVDEEKLLQIRPTRRHTMSCTAHNLDKLVLSWLENEYLLELKGKLEGQCVVSHFWPGPNLHIIYEYVDIDEILLEWLDPLLENLKFFLRYNDRDLLASLKEQFEDLEDKLILLRKFLQIIGREISQVIRFSTDQDLCKRSHNLLNRIKVLVKNAMDVTYLCWLKKMNEKMSLKNMIIDLLLKIKHIEPQMRMIFVQVYKVSDTANPGNLGVDLQALVSVDFLLDNVEELLNLHSGSIISTDDHQIAILQVELKFLRYFLMDPHLKNFPELDRFNSLLIQVEAMAREGASSIHSLCVSQDVAKGIDPLLDLLKYIHLLKAEIREIYLRIPKPSTSEFPSNPKLGFIDSFLARLDELLKHGSDAIAYLKNKIENVQSELLFLRSFLEDALKHSKKTKKHEDIEQRIVKVAHEAECVIDSIAASIGPLWYYILWLSDIVEKMELLRTEVAKMREEMITELNEEKVPNNYRLQLQANAPQIHEEVVGFEDQAEMIIDYLTRGSKKRGIVSLVGMPGLGKTTLAKKLYDYPSITSYFHVRSWCCVSQIYELKQLLLDILEDIIELTMQIYEMSADDLAEVLCKNLKGKTYLIVMDDIWDVEAWSVLRMSLPDDNNGSRIMFTSRIREVALKANPDGALHEPRLLSKKESWELLQKKVFQQQNCPPELSGLGEKIAENCKGLPLALVVIAGVLLSTDKSKDLWEEIAESLGKHVVGDLRRCMDVLELSYKHLPSHLKPCFLYFGAFPEDKIIPVRKLIRLWIAEGFVPKNEAKSSDTVAEDCLMDLISRSLVIPAKRKCRGVKACGIHDLLHEFCLTKAKEENFLLRLHGSEENIPFPDALELNVDSHSPQKHRMCFYSKRRDFYEWRSSVPFVRSVLFFPTEQLRYLKCSYPNEITSFCYRLRLLRVLELGHINMGTSFDGIELLVYLRYLAVRGEMTSIPASVGSLRRLETFLVKGLMGEIKLPTTLWNMARLKHVCIDDRAAFQLPDCGPDNYINLHDIETLSTPCLRYGDETIDNIIRKLSGLRKLKCIFLESLDYSRRSNRFPALDYLNKLESLKVIYHGGVQYPGEFNFPSNIKKLTLSKFRLPWSAISKIGKLPNLEVLKLLYRAFEGQRWDVSAEEFLNLKVLKLDSLNISHLNASDEAFPRLQRLVLQRCKQLREISPSLGEISTLEMIEVHSCGRGAAAAVREIQEEQGLGDDGLKVIIQPPDLDPASASNQVN